MQNAHEKERLHNELVQSQFDQMAFELRTLKGHGVEAQLRGKDQEIEQNQRMIETLTGKLQQEMASQMTRNQEIQELRRKVENLEQGAAGKDLVIKELTEQRQEYLEGMLGKKKKPTDALGIFYLVPCLPR